MSELTDKLIEIWTGEIAKDYCDGLICSERHLQAIMYRRYFCAFQEYQIWVEPILYFNIEQKFPTKNPRPDFMFVKEGKIAAVIEIKYKPGEDVKEIKDIQKLNFLSNLSPDVEIEISTKAKFDIANPSKDVDYKRIKYRLDENLVTVFAVIGKTYKVAPEHQFAFYQDKFRYDYHFDAIAPEKYHLKNFLHLVGRIDNEPVFKHYSNAQFTEQATSIIE